MNYSFDVAIAEKYGVNEAVMIQFLQISDGRPQIYDSIRAFSILLPFWKQNEIEKILKSLIKQKILTIIHKKEGFTCNIQ